MQNVTSARILKTTIKALGAYVQYIISEGC